MASAILQAPPQAPLIDTEPDRRARTGHRALWIAVLLLMMACGAGWTFQKVWRVKPLAIAPAALLPYPAIHGGQTTLYVPGYIPAATVAEYQDELFAYMMFGFLQPSLEVDGRRLLLTFDRRSTAKPYRLVLLGPTDNKAAFADGAGLAAMGTILENYSLLPRSTIERFEQQTRLFVSAYNLPVRRKFEQMPKASLSRYLQRFVRFKSRVDPRIRARLEPAPTPLTSEEAGSLTGDILTVAEHYDLPLDFFLAIGAVENNYMNVRGDLEHSIWKRRAAPDDIVLERRRGRVRVLNDSAGVWQITRETLRYAHKLWQKDERDRNLLPEHLRPPEELRIDEVSPHVLTTYAGLLLRDLLDRFDGDITLAVSAYNGGPGRPNLRYGEGVQKAAEHARRVVEQAASLNGESVMETTWLRRP